MKKTQIKICGIKDPELAFKTAKIGADYIGLLFYKPSIRNISRDQAKEVSAAIQEGGAKAVGVFVQQGHDEILNICKQYTIAIAQLHGNKPRDAYKSLSPLMPCLYVIPVFSSGAFNPYFPEDILHSHKDFVLFDNQEGGSGRLINANHIKSFTPALPFFIAGGLHAQNVKKIIQEYKPYGIDVSSGVENENKEKTLELIKNFIDAAHQ